MALIPTALTYAPNDFQKVALTHILTKQPKFTYDGSKYTLLRGSSNVVLKSNQDYFYVSNHYLKKLTVTDVIMNHFSICDGRVYTLREDDRSNGETWFYYGYYNLGDYSSKQWEILFRRLNCLFNCVNDEWSVDDYNKYKSQLVTGVQTNEVRIEIYLHGFDIKSYRGFKRFLKCSWCQSLSTWFEGNYQLECHCHTRA